MLSQVVKATVTPLHSLSPPGDASPSPSSPIPTHSHSPPQVTASVPLQVKVQAPSPTSSATPPTGSLMHKNDLNSCCQRLGLPLPVYETTFQGSCHAPRFTSTVSVGQKSFTSPSSFANRKSAEQDAAKLALQHLLNEDEARTTNLRAYLRKLVCLDKARCKMILNEFLAKIKMECAYETVQVDMSPVFVSSLSLNGTCYKGEGGKNKKDAEQLAALAAILSFLDDPAYATPISEVMKSKFNACAVFNELKVFPNTRDCSVTSNEFKATTSNSDAMPVTQQALSIGQSSFGVEDDEKMPTSVDVHANNIEEQGGSGILVSENKQVLVNSLSETEKQVSKNPQVLQTSLPQTEKRGAQGVLDDKQGVAGHPTGAVTIPRCSCVNLPRTSPLISESQHEIKLSEAAQPASPQINVSTEFVPAAAHSPGNDLICSKKRRRKNKKKANKRLRAENKQVLVNSLSETEKLVNKYPQVFRTSLPQTEKRGGQGVLDDKQGVAGHPTGAVTISRCSYVNLPISSPLISESQHEIKLSEATQPASQKIKISTEFVPAAAHSPGRFGLFQKVTKEEQEEGKQMIAS